MRNMHTVSRAACHTYVLLVCSLLSMSVGFSIGGCCNTVSLKILFCAVVNGGEGDRFLQSDVNPLPLRVVGRGGKFDLLGN